MNDGSELTKAEWEAGLRVQGMFTALLKGLEWREGKPTVVGFMVRSGPCLDDVAVLVKDYFEGAAVGNVTGPLAPYTAGTGTMPLPGGFTMTVMTVDAERGLREVQVKIQADGTKANRVEVLDAGTLGTRSSDDDAPPTPLATPEAYPLHEDPTLSRRRFRL